MKKLFSVFFKGRKSRDRAGVLVWLALHLGIPALLLISLFSTGPVRVNAGLFDIVPVSRQYRAAAEADRILAEKNGRQTVILAGAKEFRDAKEGAALLYARLEKSAGFRSLSLYQDSSAVGRIGELLYNYRFVTAGKDTLELLEYGGAEEIAGDALAEAFGAFTFFPLDNIEKDPFLLANRRMEEFLASSLLTGGNITLREDVLGAQKDGLWYVLIRGTLSSEAVSITGGREPGGGNSMIGEIYLAAESVKEELPGLEFYFSGVPFHSYESSSGAQKEISLISSISMAIILLLFLYIFRSPLPVIFSMLSAGISIGLASAAALLVFREIHIITAVFGTTLIGTSVDYSVHFFVHWKGNAKIKNGKDIRRLTVKSALMSFISTELCFFVFLFPPFPVLKQFAVFSITGLLSSLLTSLLLFPLLPLPPKEKRRLPRRVEKIFSPSPRGTARAARLFRAGIIAVISVCALAFLFSLRSNLKIENNLSSLYSMSPFLLESEKRSAEVLNHGSPGWYFIVSGSSPGETLEREELLTRRLEREISRGTLGAFLGSSVFVPSPGRQEKTYRLMEALLPLADSQIAALGFPREYADAFRGEYALAKGRYILPDNPLAADFVSNLWIGENGGGFYSCVLPLHPSDEKSFLSIAEEFDFVYFINKSKDIKTELDSLTKTMLILFLVSYVLAAVLVRLVYPREAVKICALPVFSVLTACAALTAAGEKPGFFPAAAGILVFGLGLDYIFYLTKNSGGKQLPPASGGEAYTRLAVTLSFLTTLLSFGALGLSGFAPAHVFGITVSSGLCAAYVFAVLLGKKD
ncbi:MAG: MMPL family transporter [Treponema sp.]|jgi:predicted exporter|nr:MMPL family transporter [Treponema sp.]